VDDHDSEGRSTRQIAIRRATTADAPALGRMGAQLMRVHFAMDPLRFLDPGDRPEAGYASFLRHQLQDDEQAVFVAESNGAVIGYVYAGVEPLSWKELRDRAGFVHDIVVLEDERRGGVATALLSAAIEWLATRNVPRVMLWTAHRNAAAQALFERLGFRRTMVEMTREI
jgi:ribosomal protein S18 acetylase RimI-like enzyme